MTVGLLQFTGQASRFNGGKSQIQSGSIATGGFELINLMKTGTSWVATGASVPINGSQLDNNGYPTSLPAGTTNLNTTIFSPLQSSRPGNYVMAWDGNGTATNNGSLVAYTITAATNAAQAVLTLSASNGITTGALVAGNAPAVNQQLVVTGAAGDTWSGLNTTVTIQNVNISTSQVTVNVNSTGFGTYTASSGTMTNSLVSTNGGGRAVLTSTGNQWTLGVGVVGITNIRFYHINDEALYTANVAAGKTWGGFSTQFLNVVRALNPAVYRFMDLQGAGGSNSTNMTDWASRKPINYVYYNGGEFRSSFWTAVTATGTTKLLGSFGAGDPVDRQIVQIQWPSTVKNSTVVSVNIAVSTTNITFPAHNLQVGDTVAWPQTGNGTYTAPSPFTKSSFGTQTVYYVQSVVDANTITLSATNGGSAIVMTDNGVGSGSSMTLSPVMQFQMNNSASVINIGGAVGQFPNGFGSNFAPIANGNATLIYDAGFGLWLKFGTPGTDGARGFLDNGWPPEVMIELCKEIGAHPWVCQPFLASDTGTASNKLLGGTDWATQFATYIKTNGPSWMIPRFEGSNEQWNSLFYANGYATNKATLYGWGDTYNNAFGKAMSCLGQDVNAVYGGAVNGTKYHIIAGVQTHLSSPTANGTAGADNRLNAAAFVAAGGSAAYNWVTHIAVDMYITPDAFFTNQEFAWASDYAINGTAANLNLYADTLANGTTGNFTLSFMNALYIQWQAWAAQSKFNSSAGTTKLLTGYEGGWNAAYNGATFANTTCTSVITNISAATNAVFTLSRSNMWGAQGATFTGTVAGDGVTLTVSGVTGTVQTGRSISGGGILANTYIASGSGTTWTLSRNQGGALGPSTMNSGNMGNPAVVGMQFTISGITDVNYTSLNGLVANITGVAGDLVTTDINTNGFPAFATGSGTATYRKDASTTAQSVVNALRLAAKKLASDIQQYTYGGAVSNYGNFIAAGGVFPTQFHLANSSFNPPYTGTAYSGDAWGMYDPDVYATPSAAQAGIAAFNVP